MDYIEKRITYLEKELEQLKNMVKNSKKKPVSFSGMAKTKLTNNHLDEEIRNSRKSIFSHGDV